MTTLTTLRSLSPHRPLTLLEAQRVAEQQATRLLRDAGLTEASVPDEVVTELPNVQVERLYRLPDTGERMPVSGSAHWLSGRWLILIDSGEPVMRQRFTLCHEVKHAIDGSASKLLYRGTPELSPTAQRERVANYFAACLLMPRTWVKRDWAAGLQDERQLARYYQVSVQAMHTRLSQLGLLMPVPRCLSAA